MNKIIDKIGIYRHHGKIAKEIIEDFEVNSLCCFPKEYKELISNYNALRPIKTAFDFINVYGKKDEGSIFFLGYGDIEFSKMDKNLRIADPIYYGTPGLIDFGGYANGDYICFDYRHDPKTCNPKVVHVYHDDYTENEDGTFSMTVNFVANSFEEFIDMLYEYNE